MSLCFLTAEAMQPASSCSHHWELTAMMDCIPLDREPEIIPFLELFFVRYFITAMIKVTNPARCSLVALASSHGQFYYLVGFT